MKLDDHRHAGALGVAFPRKLTLGNPSGVTALAARVSSAVEEMVRRQIEAGIGIINDGEMSKPSYATYVKDRLHGFGGESVQSYFSADLVDYPRSAEMVADNPGRRKRSAPACNATGKTCVHICFGYAALIHERPAGYSFLPELHAALRRAFGRWPGPRKYGSPKRRKRVASGAGGGSPCCT